MTIRLVLADDHAIFLQGLELHLGAEPDLDVVATCLDGNEALRAVREFLPDVLVVDMKMPGGGGLGVLRELDRAALSTRVVVLAASLEEGEVVAAMRLGARGMVLKEMAPRFLTQCVRKVHAGELWLELRTAGKALEALLRGPGQEDGEPLTPRETELLKMVALGLQNKEIASRLGITEGTVKVHLHAVYGKVRVSNRLALVRWAESRGLV